MGESFHAIPILDKLAQIYADEFTKDLALVSSSGQRFRVHKAVLALASGFFWQVLAESPDGHEMLLTDFTSSTLQSFLSLLYTGQCTHPESHRREIEVLCRAARIPIQRFRMPDEHPHHALTVKLEENLTKSKARRREIETRERFKKKKKRILTSELDPSDLKCPVCGKEFPVLYKLKMHSLIHSETYPFRCQTCGKGFNNKYKMRNHEKKSHHISSKGDEPPDEDQMDHFVPDVPDEDPDDALGPSLETLGKTCEECAIEFATKGAYQDHMALRHPDFKTFLCSTCGKGLKSQKGLDHHMNLVCNKVKKVHGCSICPMMCPTLAELRKHELSHGPKPEFKCAQCPTICSTRKGLRVHEKSVHLSESSPNPLPHRCGHCDKSFLKATYLQDHVNRFHSTTKQFGCILCPKRCATKQDLDRHLFSHRGEAIFQCSFCPKSFIHRANYKQHVRSHLGQKPYKCVPCDKSFGLLGVLRKHQKSHKRKGDHTQIVTAPKGRRGHMSYIDFADAPSPEPEIMQPVTPPIVHHRPQVYIPSGQYIQSSHQHRVTSLAQVIGGGDYGELTYYNMTGGGGSATNDFTPSSNLNPSAVTSVSGAVSSIPSIGRHNNYDSFRGGGGHLNSMLDPTPLKTTPIESGLGTNELTTPSEAETGPNLNQQTVVFQHSNQSHQTFPLHHTVHSQELTETESIAMDIMGLFNESSVQGTEKSIEHL
ncbi:hypothetical protein TCAL_10248 [Tigriopus californicus]|uniref:BTB domain-containing protein n=1 Tax=Tigriopus californicus TaxID=6832 RepID=A0A553NB00_TIGCA|nr:zinc finger protein 227-like [Tigriopus californicus]TRY62622.1 hypothetical protein TCAL_10248 [Tigriopus californicus]|eukprot:TCALIF_10248-PA protein Name:"Similar to ZNF728 Zinc finger protein 728 (Homo sapiens)" AED:0.02 eAED:0.02 QI:29/1/1/1/1/1/4/55/709